MSFRVGFGSVRAGAVATLVLASAQLTLGCREYTCFDTATCTYVGPDGAVDASVLDASTSDAASSDTTPSGRVADASGTPAEPDTRDAAPSGATDGGSVNGGGLDASWDGASSVEVTARGDAGELGRTSTTPSIDGGGTTGTEAGVSPSSSTQIAEPQTSEPTGPVEDPAGYWRQDPWSGCVWSAIDDTGSGTSLAPTDFTHTEGGDYCVAGAVAATEDWMGAATLGFYLNQSPVGTSCAYEPLDETAALPPAVVPTKNGLAFNFAKRGPDRSFDLRVVLWGPNGSSDSNERWCADIEHLEGKQFVAWGDFNTECWGGSNGTAYANQAISAVVFTVPGEGWPAGEQGSAADVAFDFCVKGLAPGDSAEDAPNSDNHASGTLGGTAAGADYERAVVTVDGETYVIQNNNWGNELGAQTLSFENDSFVITDGPDGVAGCQGCPLSFPSIFVGANGDTNDGEYTTRLTDNLPASIGSITSATTRVAWSGNPGAAASASYDLWFASPSRGDLSGKRYNDALDGAIMIWLHDPPSAQPIGSDIADVTINGVQWDVWVGPRGQGVSSGGADLIANANAPVVSYVVKSTSNTFDGDLTDFMEDAKLRSNQFDDQLLLTDVFFGFEVWSGGAGLGVDHFTVDVRK